MDNEYFWVNTIFIVILLTLYLTIVRRIHKQKIHLYIYTAVWGVLVFGNQVVGIPYTVNITTLIVVYASWITFLVGAIAVYLFYTSKELDNREEEVIYSAKRLRFALFVLIGMSILANYLFYTNVFSKLQGLTSLAYLRSSESRSVLTEPNMFFNVFGRGYNIYIPVAFLLYNKKQLSSFILTIIVIIGFITSASAFTRAPVLNLLVCILVSVVCQIV